MSKTTVEKRLSAMATKAIIKYGKGKKIGNMVCNTFFGRKEQEIYQVTAMPNQYLLTERDVNGEIAEGRLVEGLKSLFN